MLPSGNDAAHQLAEYFGTILKKESDEREAKRIQEEKQKEEEAKAAAEPNEEDENESLPTADTNNTLKGDGQEQENSSNECLNNQENSDVERTKTNTAVSAKEPSRASSKKKLNNMTSPRNNKSDPNIPFNIKKSPYVAKGSQFRNNQPLLYFLEEMNKTAEFLDLKNSFYDSPHGLSNYQNRSSALDIAKLSTKCMKIK